MRTIYKYHIGTLVHSDGQHIRLLKAKGSDHRVLHVGLDPEGIPSIWVELTPGTYEERVNVSIVGTGGRVDETKTHIGSFVDGPFVWHVYV